MSADLVIRYVIAVSEGEAGNEARLFLDTTHFLSADDCAVNFTVPKRAIETLKKLGEKEECAQGG